MKNRRSDKESVTLVEAIVLILVLALVIASSNFGTWIGGSFGETFGSAFSIALLLLFISSATRDMNRYDLRPRRWIFRGFVLGVLIAVVNAILGNHRIPATPKNLLAGGSGGMIGLYLGATFGWITGHWLRSRRRREVSTDADQR